MHERTVHGAHGCDIVEHMDAVKNKAMHICGKSECSDHSRLDDSVLEYLVRLVCTDVGAANWAHRTIAMTEALCMEVVPT